MAEYVHQQAVHSELLGESYAKLGPKCLVYLYPEETK